MAKDLFFPRKKSVFTTSFSTDGDFKVIEGEEDKYVEDFTMQDMSDTSEYREQELVNGFTCYQLGNDYANYPHLYDTTKISINLAQHIPAIKFKYKSAMDYTDMTSYEVSMLWNSPFQGDMTVDVYNVDASNIDITQFYAFNIDQTATSTSCQGIVTNIDIPAFSLEVKSKDEISNFHMDICKINEALAITDRTRIELSDMTINQILNCKVAGSGKYLLLFYTSANDDCASVFAIKTTFVATEAIPLSDRTTFNDKTELYPYYGSIDEDTTVAFTGTLISNSTVMSNLTTNGNRIQAFRLASDEMSLYKAKNISFNNYQGGIDTTVVVLDSSGGLDFSSQDTTFTANIPVSLDNSGSLIEVLADGIVQDQTYDIGMEFIFSPCIASEIHVNNPYTICDNSSNYTV